MARLAVVIPAFGRVDLTRAVVVDALRERLLVDVWVVDNAGDYVSVADEHVLRPGQNLGWLRGCNAGAAAAAAHDRYAGVVLLNNDTRLSTGFFAGLAAAGRTRRAGLVGPCYDDHWAHQRCAHTGPATDYAPQPVDRKVRFLDGTCLLVTAGALEAVAPGGLPLLDEQSFGVTGWGADVDLAARVRRARLRVLVTERAYLNHLPASTAREVHADYDAYWAAGTEDLQAGLAAKYGPRWATVTGWQGGRRAALRRLLRLR